MIKKNASINDSDLDKIMNIWLNSNFEAHPFIAKSYWEDNYEAVSQQIKQAAIYLCMKDGKINAFAGLVDNYISGIFVTEKYRQKGIGTKLINAIKEDYSKLSLSVFEKNKLAIKFYKKNQFEETNREIDPDTSEVDLTFEWKR